MCFVTWWHSRNATAVAIQTSQRTYFSLTDSLTRPRTWKFSIIMKFFIILQQQRGCKTCKQYLQRDWYGRRWVIFIHGVWWHQLFLWFSLWESESRIGATLLCSWLVGISTLDALFAVYLTLIQTASRVASAMDPLKDVNFY